MLPVPEQDADELRDLVAERQRSRDEPVASAAAEVRDRELLAAAVKQGTLDRTPQWSTAGYAHIAEGTSITMRRIGEVMHLLAAHPEQWFSTEDIVAQTSLTLEEWRNACRNILKRINAEFPEAPVRLNGEYEGERVWPFGRHRRTQNLRPGPAVRRSRRFSVHAAARHGDQNLHPHAAKHTGPPKPRPRGPPPRIARV